MTEKSATMTRVLINRYHKGSPEPLLRFLPEGQAEEVLKQEVASPDFSLLFASPLEQVSRIHYSWFLPLIKKLPSKAQSSLLRAFPQVHAERISSLLKVAKPEQSSAPPVQTYLLSLILKNLMGTTHVLPLGYLPATPLTTLAGLGKNALVEVIGLLGIHDLAEDIRHVVDNKKIKEIYSCLTAKEQHYLRYCMHLKEKFTVPSLGLEKWAGDCEKMKSALQARGLMRLGKALSGEHPDFIWHLAHILDAGRGQALSKNYAKKPVAGITPALSQQVINLMSTLKKKSSP